MLVVDDEAGIGTFIITALLESHGIEVKAVTSTAAALEEIEQFQPDIALATKESALWGARSEAGAAYSGCCDYCVSG